MTMPMDAGVPMEDLVRLTLDVNERKAALSALTLRIAQLSADRDSLIEGLAKSQCELARLMGRVDITLPRTGGDDGTRV